MKSWYMFVFQLPWMPEFMISQLDFSNFNVIFCGMKAGVQNLAAFTPEAVEAYKIVFSQPGASTRPIKYYRCILDNFLAEENNKIAEKSINVPTLIIWDAGDLFF